MSTYSPHRAYLEEAARIIADEITVCGGDPARFLRRIQSWLFFVHPDSNPLWMPADVVLEWLSGLTQYEKLRRIMSLWIVTDLIRECGWSDFVAQSQVLSGIYLFLRKNGRLPGPPDKVHTITDLVPPPLRPEALDKTPILIPDDLDDNYPSADPFQGDDHPSGFAHSEESISLDLEKIRPLSPEEEALYQDSDEMPNLEPFWEAFEVLWNIDHSVFHPLSNWLTFTKSHRYDPLGLWAQRVYEFVMDMDYEEARYHIDALGRLVKLLAQTSETFLPVHASFLRFVLIDADAFISPVKLTLTRDSAIWQLIHQGWSLGRISRVTWGDLLEHHTELLQPGTPLRQWYDTVQRLEAGREYAFCQIMASGQLGEDDPLSRTSIHRIKAIL